MPVERGFKMVRDVAAAVEAAIEILAKAVPEVGMGAVFDQRFGGLAG
jgi:hypothetical protein